MSKSPLRTLFLQPRFSVQGSAHQWGAVEPGVYLYNWFGLIAPETPEEFEQETGSRIHMDAFDSAEIMQSKVMAGRTGYDVVVATSNVLPSLIQAGVLQPLDRNQLSNLSHIDPDILSQLAVNDPGNRYAVPYLWGTTGIGYDVAKVKAALGDDAPVNSWDLIFKEENISKLKSCGVAMLDSPSEIISIALHYLGLPSNSKNPDDYQKAQALLLKKSVPTSSISTHPKSTLTWLMAIFVQLWDGLMVPSLRRPSTRRPTLDARLPTAFLARERWFGRKNLVLLKDAPHPKEGMAFINYMLRPEVIAKTSNHTLYPNANKDAYEFVERKLRDNAWIYPDPKTVATLVPLEPLPLKLERIRTRIWTKVKSGT
ncbi:extracellular solute-binding protein [Pseudomonas lini]